MLISFESFVRLGVAFTRVMARKLVGVRGQLAQFVAQYERDGIVLFARGDREVLHGASACIACGRCDVAALERGAFSALGPRGPMAFVLGVSRHSGEHDAAELGADASRALLEHLTEVCPVDVPFVPLAQLVARRREKLLRVRASVPDAGTRVEEDASEEHDVPAETSVETSA